MDTSKSIVGDWIGKDIDNNPVLISIYDNGSLILSIGKDVVNGTWRLDDTKCPAMLDFDLHTDDHLTLRMIVCFLSDDALQIRVDESNTGSRPIEFMSVDDGDTQTTFMRKKEKY